MALALEPFGEIGLDESLFRVLLEEHESGVVPGLERLWLYYRNPRVGTGFGSAALAQASGLPARLRGRGSRLNVDDRAGDVKEVVIENDIAWRVNAMVDFVFGKPIRVVSQVPDEGRRREIESLIDCVLEASGGGAMLRDAGLLGAVYGHVDFVVRVDGLFEGGSVVGDVGSFEDVLGFAKRARVEIVEALRAVPVLDPSDFRELRGYLICSDEQTNEVGEGGRLVSRVVEVLSAGHRQVYRDGELFEDAVNPLGELPVVHVQDTSEPYSFAGMSEVEPLIPTQDELNTRLSDRAHRVTMQSFKMYLAKGIDGFGETPVGPGQVWTTENEGAQVESFGGDMNSPSEDAHIDELRQAMDKISSVSPVVIGVIRERLGQLSSENALRVTLTGILGKTERKRISYGRAIAEVSRLILRALDASGVYRTDESERGIRVVWRDPIPIDRESELRAARQRVELGVPVERVLAELGYGSGDTGVI